LLIEGDESFPDTPIHSRKGGSNQAYSPLEDEWFKKEGRITAKS